MSEWVAGLLVLVVAPLLWGLMYLGWRARGRRQAGLDTPLSAPPGGDVGKVVVLPASVTYVSTVTAGNWLDRVVAHGLGVRSSAVLHAGASGLWFQRSGAPDLFVPAAEILAIRRERGIAGKYTLEEGVVVVRWRLGEVELDTGFRPTVWAEAHGLVTVLQELVPEVAA